jgi:hypothetical protein
MAQHRFVDQLSREPRLQPAAPAVASSGFMACPAALCGGWSPMQWAWQQQLYAWAFEQARAVLRPSVLERVGRDLLN